MGRRRSTIWAIVPIIFVTGCARSAARQYELQGQVIAVDTARQEVTIKHEDIPKFMPGMTMPFRVADRTLMEGRLPGEMVRATLVVDDSGAHLSRIEHTGHAPLPAPAAPPHVLAAGEQVPDVELTDQRGARKRLSGWQGQVLAVTFIYTRCPLPNFCPLMDRRFKETQETIRADRTLAGRVHLVSISFDPDYDRPTVLEAHAARAGADPAHWTFATGDRAGIDAFAARLGVSILRQDPANVEIVHNLRTAVIDGRGRLSAVLNGNEWAAGDLIAAIRHAAAQP